MYGEVITVGERGIREGNICGCGCGKTAVKPILSSDSGICGCSWEKFWCGDCSEC